MISLPILFIGPVRAGKSTLAQMVAQQLGLQRVSLDEVRWNYYAEIGYDADLAKQIRTQGGFLAMLYYRRLFDAYSVERVIGDYPQSVIDCGAGIGPFENTDHLKRIQSLFQPLPNIFLLLPSPNIDDSLQILRQRDVNPPADLTFDINAHFINHPGYQLLSKHTIYTKNTTPEATASEVIKMLK